MAHRNPADDRQRATDPQVYLPAGVTPSFEGRRVRRLWAALFDYQVEPPE